MAVLEPRELAEEIIDLTSLGVVRQPSDEESPDLVVAGGVRRRGKRVVRGERRLLVVNVWLGLVERREGMGRG